MDFVKGHILQGVPSEQSCSVGAGVSWALKWR